MSDPVVIGVGVAAGVVMLALFAYATRKRGPEHVYEEDEYTRVGGKSKRRRSSNRSRKK
jgi:hypothetical protein